MATGPETPEPPGGWARPSPWPFGGSRALRHLDSGSLAPRTGREWIPICSPGNLSLRSNQEKARSSPGLEISCGTQHTAVAPADCPGREYQGKVEKMSQPRHPKGIATCHVGCGIGSWGRKWTLVPALVTWEQGLRWTLKSREGGAYAHFKVWSGPTGSQGPV